MPNDQKVLVILAEAIGQNTENKLAQLIEANHPIPFHPSEYSRADKAYLGRAVRSGQRKLERLGTEWIKRAGNWGA